MDKIFHIDILTPYGKYLSTDADFLSITTPVGVLGILPNHAALVTTVEICKIVIKSGNNKYEYATSGGLMHIKEDTRVVLLLKSIERSDEIDLERANSAKERANKRLTSAVSDVDIMRAKLSLARALNRISVYKGK